jgi:hypothetical protein
VRPVHDRVEEQVGGGVAVDGMCLALAARGANRTRCAATPSAATERKSAALVVDSLPPLSPGSINHRYELGTVRRT